MSVHGWRVHVALVCLAGLIGGCQGVPRLPKAGQSPPPRHAGSAEDDEDEGGRLFDRLTGRKRKAPRQAPESEVVPTSAIEPVPPPPGSRISVSPVSPFDDEEKDEDDGFQWSDLEPTNAYNSIKAWAGYGPDEGLARQLYREGEDLFRQKRYGEAAAKFKSAAGRWPDSILEEDAMFMRGESLFFSDQYAKADDVYGNLLKEHDNSRHLDKVVARQFAIGRYWEQKHTADSHWPVTPNLTDKSLPLFDTWGNAMKAYDSVREHDPTGPLADDSVMAAANANFLKGRFEEAAYNYDLLRKQYTKSEHQLQAHLLGIKAKQEMYQGSMYDGKPLGEAGELCEQTLMHFQDDLGDERSHVVQSKNRVVEQRAGRDWAMAQFYEKKKLFGAARYYYRALIDEFPQTQVARAAQTRLEEIKDEPDEPPQRAKWLTDLFPSGTK